MKYTLAHLEQRIKEVKELQKYFSLTNEDIQIVMEDGADSWVEQLEETLKEYKNSKTKKLEKKDYAKCSKDELDKLYELCGTPYPEQTTMPDIDKYIEMLDQGASLKLKPETISKIIDQLWNERDSVSVRVVNDEISLN